MEKPLDSERNQRNDVSTAEQIMNNPRNDAPASDTTDREADYAAVSDDLDVPVPPR